ncbi:MAG: SPFH domain-containing protein [Phycisphaerae bacterium]
MHHHHGHDHGDDVGPPADEAPLDAASQSLADALRSSFGILKGIMVILVVLYLVSNIRGIGGHEEALVLRLGKLLPDVREAGLVLAFPFPIDEIVRLPTKKSNALDITSHTFFRKPNEIGKRLSFISRGEGGLHPTLDGALLTADTGLVHVQWKVTYKIDDVQAYVTRMAGRKIEAAESLIRTMVETTGIAVASEMTAEEIIRTRVDYAQSEMKRRINRRLAQLETGISVESVEMYEPTPPLAVRKAFERTQQAENAKEQRIRQARRDRTRRLNETAGSIYPNLVAALDRLAAEDTPEHRAEADRWLERAEGEAGQLIKDAQAYFSIVVGRMKSDVQQYRTLVPEYERNAGMLVERLWEATRVALFENPEVVKLYRPPGLAEFRLQIPLDPEQSRAEEAAKLKKKTFNMEELRPKKYHVIGPEYD